MVNKKKEKIWRRDDIKLLIYGATRYTLFSLTPEDLDNFLKHKPISDMQMNLRWLHGITHYASWEFPYALGDLYYEDVTPEQWLAGIQCIEYLDNISDKQIIWLFSMGLKQADIQRLTKMDRQTIANRYEHILDVLERALRLKHLVLDI